MRFELQILSITRIMVNNGHLLTATLETLDFWEIF